MFLKCSLGILVKKDSEKTLKSKEERGINMARGQNQKLKLLYLLDIFQRETDEEHGITVPEIIERLKTLDINAERKSLYTDFEELTKYGVEIISQKKDKKVKYFMADRKFEIAELKMLVDSVLASKYISEKKTENLIKKIEGFASKYQAHELQRQVYIQGRTKTRNESVLYNVDAIHQAMGENKQISFEYFYWNSKKQKVNKKSNGELYKVSPWALVLDQENYYLVAYDEAEAKIKHYRVDKMEKIVLAEEARIGAECFEEQNVASYTKRYFSMFGGEKKRVTLEFEDKLAGVVIDRFGMDVSMRPSREGYFCVSMDLEISDMFYAWVMGLGTQVKIISPSEIVEEMKKKIMQLMTNYD